VVFCLYFFYFVVLVRQVKKKEINIVINKGIPLGILGVLAVHFLVFFLRKLLWYNFLGAKKEGEFMAYTNEEWMPYIKEHFSNIPVFRFMGVDVEHVEYGKAVLRLPKNLATPGTICTEDAWLCLRIWEWEWLCVPYSTRLSQWSVK
jgi:hypothetical protein